MKEFIEKLIGGLEEEKTSTWNVGYKNGLDCAIQIVNELAEEHKGGWIPCKERMPEDGQIVIFSTEEGIVKSGWYEAKHNWCANDGYFPNAFHFIAWQPLPDPYIEKS